MVLRRSDSSEPRTFIPPPSPPSPSSQPQNNVAPPPPPPASSGPPMIESRSASAPTEPPMPVVEPSRPSSNATPQSSDSPSTESGSAPPVTEPPTIVAGPSRPSATATPPSRPSKQPKSKPLSRNAMFSGLPTIKIMQSFEEACNLYRNWIYSFKVANNNIQQQPQPESHYDFIEAMEVILMHVFYYLSKLFLYRGFAHATNAPRSGKAFAQMLDAVSKKKYNDVASSRTWYDDDNVTAKDVARLCAQFMEVGARDEWGTDNPMVTPEEVTGMLEWVYKDLDELGRARRVLCNLHYHFGHLNMSNQGENLVFLKSQLHEAIAELVNELETLRPYDNEEDVTRARKLLQRIRQRVLELKDVDWTLEALNLDWDADLRADLEEMGLQGDGVGEDLDLGSGSESETDVEESAALDAIVERAKTEGKTTYVVSKKHVFEIP